MLFIMSLTATAQKDVQKKFLTQFIEAEHGSVIQLPAGTYQLDASLWLDGKHDVTIQGAGMEKTILNFKGQVTGAEGIKVTNSQRITIADLTIQDTKGDGIKTQLVEGITFNRVKTEWTEGPDEKNGGYGLYPVQCTNVLIEHCEVRGASDAGIYVGQSKYIIVRHCKAYENVAGIEIENSLHADVYANEAYNNTGGILVFDLPDLIQKEGGFVRVFQNLVHDNNHNNFAPKGNIVGKVPPGTGVIILATGNVEIFENKIINNNTVSTSVISYYMTENPINDKTYRPYPHNIHIHDNVFERQQVRATGKGRMGKMYRFKLRFGKKVPHIQYDGIEDEKMKERNICIRNNKNESFVNLKAANGFKGMSRDLTQHNCAPIPLPAVELTASGK